MRPGGSVHPGDRPPVGSAEDDAAADKVKSLQQSLYCKIRCNAAGSEIGSGAENQVGGALHQLFGRNLSRWSVGRSHASHHGSSMRAGFGTSVAAEARNPAARSPRTRRRTAVPREDAEVGSGSGLGVAYKTVGSRESAPLSKIATEPRVELNLAVGL